MFIHVKRDFLAKYIQVFRQHDIKILIVYHKARNADFTLRFDSVKLRSIVAQIQKFLQMRHSCSDVYISIADLFLLQNFFGFHAITAHGAAVHDNLFHRNHSFYLFYFTGNLLSMPIRK